MSDYQPALSDSSRFACVGIDESVLACIRSLQNGASVHIVVFDTRVHSDNERLAGVVYYDGLSEEQLVDEVKKYQPDYLVPAAYIDDNHPVIHACRDSAIEIVSEIELAWRMRRVDSHGNSAPWLCVTGAPAAARLTTFLTGEILRHHEGMTLAICETEGFLGKIATIENEDNAVVLLNVPPHHLRFTSTVSPLAAVCVDYDCSLGRELASDYDNAGRVYEGVRAACIYQVENERVQAMVDKADVVEGARAIGVSVRVPRLGDIGLVGEDDDWVVVDRAFGARRNKEPDILCSYDDIAPLFPASASLAFLFVYSLMTAAALARSLGVSAETIRHALHGVSHSNNGDIEMYLDEYSAQ